MATPYLFNEQAIKRAGFFQAKKTICPTAVSALKAKRLAVKKDILPRGRQRNPHHEIPIHQLVLVEINDGKKKAGVTEDASQICHCCLSCQDDCPEQAILVKDE